ncbi:hypothetical protein [Chondromyces crocatus]|uniref:hypothetical protein n=1 Tax=Chondromyces crocatus TaxID=52 RepID=UPI0012E23BE4|nr:hypothetical protein [Chondromyces crocatus]
MISVEDIDLVPYHDAVRRVTPHSASIALSCSTRRRLDLHDRGCVSPLCTHMKPYKTCTSTTSTRMAEAALRTPPSPHEGEKRLYLAS